MINKCKAPIENLILILFMGISSFALCYILTDMTKYSMFVLPLWIFLSYLLVKQKNILLLYILKTNYWHIILLIILSLFVSIAFCLNSGIDIFVDSLLDSSIWVSAISVFTVIGLSILFFLAFILAINLLKKYELPENNFYVSYFKILFFVLIIYIFYYLCNYPAIFTPDNASQFYQCEGLVTLSNHHPVLHTLLIYLTVFLIGDGRLEPYFVVQILLVSSIVSYSIYWIGTRLKNKMVYFVVLLFMSCFPFYGYFISGMVKDIIFSAFILLMTIELAELIYSEGTSLKTSKHIMLTIIATFGVVFFRNNGIYIVLALIPLSLFFLKKSKLKLILIFVVVALIYLFATNVVYPMFSIEQGNIVESLGIPVQQISRVVVDGGNLSETELKYIDKIIPIELIKELYNPESVDNIKFNENFNSDIISGNMKEFFYVWFSLLIKNPASYFKAYFANTQMLWNPFYEAGLIEEFYESAYYTNINYNPIFPRVSSFLYTISNFMQYSDYTGPLHVFWNIAVYYIISFFLAILLLVKRKGQYVLIMFPCWILWGTLLVATPVAYAGRYAAAILFCLPLLISIALAAKNTSKLQLEFTNT